MLDEQKLLEDIFQAYFQARKNKRATTSQLEFEINYEEQLIDLHQELITNTWQPGPVRCFIVHDPVQREIIASQFKDRIVHHLIYKYIYDLCDRQFIHDSRSCRKRRGTHYGIQRIEKRIRKCSRNHTRDCWILKCDIQGFFMSIDKYILRCLVVRMIEKKKDLLSIDHSWLLQCIFKNIMHDPLQEYVIKGKKQDRYGLPKNKSLFHCESDVGLPIGNLTSQLFANVYMHYFDCWMKYHHGLKYYGRYVDDFILIHQDKKMLTSLISLMTERLERHLKLTLHPHKIYLQHYTKGANCLGAVIKPYRTYIRKRTIGNMKHRIQERNNNQGQGIDDSQLCSSLNSYLGLMKHHKTYKIRKKMMGRLGPWFYKKFTVDSDYLVCSPKK